MKFIIYYFSGTGNTKVVATLIHDLFIGAEHTGEMVNIPDILKGKRTVPDHKGAVIGLAYPIHAGDAPDIMYRFVSHLPMGNMENVFILNTAADFVHLNDATAKSLIKKLYKKQYQPFYERTIVMGCNFLMKYDDRFVKQLYQSAIDKSRVMSEEILAGKKRMRPAGALLRLIARLGHAGETFGARLYGRGLKSTDNCTHCEKCVRECPVDNIIDDKGKIRFGWKCIWCMHCVYTCPDNAIRSRTMGFSVIKDGYDVKEIIQNENISHDFVDKNSKGFYKHFYKYLQDPSI